MREVVDGGREGTSRRQEATRLSCQPQSWSPVCCAKADEKLLAQSHGERAL